MSRLKFNAKNHHYTLDGKPITGVTTILGVIAKPALIQWSANMAVDYICENISQLITGDKETQDRLLLEARKAHCQKRDKAADIGTLAHKQIEKWIKKEAPEPVSEQVKKMVDNFIDWATKNKVKFLASERQVYSEKYFFCGTYDFLCEIDNKIWLGDIKTSSGIYPEMFFQTAGYQICEEEMKPELKIDGHLIVNLKKDGTIQEKRSVSNQTNKEAFLAALTLYRALESVRGRTL
jgi:hypothetical protein